MRCARKCNAVSSNYFTDMGRRAASPTLTDVPLMSFALIPRSHLLQTLSTACQFYKLLQLVRCVALVESINDGSGGLGRRIVLHIACSMPNRHENDSHIALFSWSSVARVSSIARLLLALRAVMISSGRSCVISCAEAFGCAVRLWGRSRMVGGLKHSTTRSTTYTARIGMGVPAFRPSKWFSSARTFGAEGEST